MHEYYAFLFYIYLAVCLARNIICLFLRPQLKSQFAICDQYIKNILRHSKCLKLNCRGKATVEPILSGEFNEIEY